MDMQRFLTAVVLGAACVALGAVSTAQAAVVSHYAFDGDYTDSAGTNHGTLVESGDVDSGIVTTVGDYTFGTGGLTLSNDAGDYVSLTQTTFDTGEAFSVAFWARRTNSALDWDMVIGDRDDNVNFIALTSNNGQINGGGLRLRGHLPSTSGKDVDGIFGQDSSWHHYAVSVTTGNVATLYADGGVLPLEGTNITPSGKFTYDTIGDAYGGFEFYGQLDEIWIFDEAIDQATVTSLKDSNAVPEPMTMSLLVLGGIAMLRRRKNG